MKRLFGIFLLLFGFFVPLHKNEKEKSMKRLFGILLLLFGCFVPFFGNILYVSYDWKKDISPGILVSSALLCMFFIVSGLLIACPEEINYESKD